MEENIKEGLASIYLSRPAKVKSESKRNIFILGITFIALSVIGLLLILILNS